MRDAERALELEAAYPGLRFERYPETAESDFAGKPLGWGMIPEQATGTLNGNPFYYRFRSNHGTLSVWDGNRCSVEQVPSFSVFPILYASVDDWFPGEDFAGTTGDTKLFRHLMDNLKKPEGEDVFPVRFRESPSAVGLPLASEVREAIQKIDPRITFPEREPEWDLSASLYLDVGDLGHVELRWSDTFDPEASVTVVLYPPTDDVVLAGKSLGFAKYDCGEATAENIAAYLFENWDELSWDHLASYSNHWDGSRLYLLSSMTNNRPDFQERFEEDYSAWLEETHGIVESIYHFFDEVNKSRKNSPEE